MRRFVSISLAVLFAFCLVVGTERRAWGYIDPGAGLLTLQTLASAVAAFIYFLRRRVRALFQRNKQGKTANL
jgi:hypothetical protein